MVFVVILAHELLGYTTDTLAAILGNDNFVIVYSPDPISTASMYHNMTLASVKLHEKIIDNSQIAIDMVAVPVLTVFDRFDHTRSILSKTVSTDTVFFDTLHSDQSPTVMYTSLVASVKILKSAVKIENFLKDNSNQVKKVRSICRLVRFSNYCGTHTK